LLAKTASRLLGGLICQQREEALLMICASLIEQLPLQIFENSWVEVIK